MTDEEVIQTAGEGRLTQACDDKRAWYEVDGKIVDLNQVNRLSSEGRIGLRLGETVYHAVD